MLNTITTVAAHARAKSEREVLLKHAQLILEDGNAALPSSFDKQRVRQAYDEALKAAQSVDLG
jgi:uncharacterized membrane protein